MNGPHHYQRAEELAHEADDMIREERRGGVTDNPESLSGATILAHLAGVHATLAQVAATARPAVVEWLGDEAARDNLGWVEAIR